jgi:hypothetical protein
MRFAIPLFLLGFVSSAAGPAPALVTARDMELAPLFIGSCMTYDVTPERLRGWIASQRLKLIPWNSDGIEDIAFIEPDRMVIIPKSDGACTVMADQVDKLATDRILRGFFAASGARVAPVPGHPELGAAPGTTGDVVRIDHQSWLLVSGSQTFPDDEPGLAQVFLMAAPYPPPGG